MTLNPLQTDYLELVSNYEQTIQVLLKRAFFSLTNSEEDLKFYLNSLKPALDQNFFKIRELSQNFSTEDQYRLAYSYINFYNDWALDELRLLSPATSLENLLNTLYTNSDKLLTLLSQIN